MKKIILVSFCFAVAACGTKALPPNEQHTTHNTPANTGPAVDRNSMDHSGMEHDAMKSSPGAASAPYELQFLDSMIAHHKGAVEMAELAATRAERPEIKELAANIIDTQEREIAKMSEWRDRWFEGSSQAINMDFPGMARGMSGMDMKKLAAAKGKDFDSEFLRQMIPHHEGAIDMANDLKRADVHAEVRDLAEDIVNTQDAEIKQMREWLNTWR